jgi:hypothetical protein
MAAIEEGLRHGPLHIVKRNKPAAVVLSEDEYDVRGQKQSVVNGSFRADCPSRSSLANTA